MKKTYLYKTINVAILLLFYIVLQVFQFTTIFDDIAFPIYGYLDALLILSLGSVVFLFRSKLFDKIYLPIVYGMTIVFTLVNINFYNTVGDIFSLTNLALVDNAGNVAASAASFNVPFTILGVLSVILFALILILVDYKFFRTNNVALKLDFKRHRISKTISSICVVLLSFTAYTTTFLSLRNSNDSKNTIMLEKVSNFKKYGMLSYYMQEAPYILNGADLNNEVEQDLKTYFTTPINNESGIKNSYSGLLKDYNVVTICVETGDDLMLNEAICPNLYELFNDSINLERNYSKNKTNISEFIGMMGSAPVAGINAKYQYNLPFGLPSILKDKGYSTMYFHDAPKDKDVYKRREVMPRLGFDKTFYRDDLFPGQPGWDFSGSYSFDSDAMPVIADTILKDKDQPFYAFYMTLSMHGPYDNPKNHDTLLKNYGEKYNKIKAEGKFINPLKGTINEHCVDNFMLACMDFDKGLGEFIQKFKDAGEYEDTLFVLYGDHEMYYIGADGVALNKTLAGTQDMSNSSMYKTMMCFSNPKLKQKFGDNKYDQFTSPYNIVPTVLDLLGEDYNPNYYLGHSLFSNEMKNTQAFYSVEQAGFFNESYWALNHNDIYRKFNDNSDEISFINEVNRLYEKERRLDVIYTKDFFTNHNFSEYTL